MHFNHVSRRELIAFGSAAAVWPLVALAQQPGRQRRVGLLADFSDAQMQPLISAFRERLEKLGWTDGNIRIDYRLAIGESAQFKAAAAALVGLAPDVVVTQGSPALRAIRQETSVIPVVFTFAGDPVAQGFVESSGRPGGNLTGFTNIAFSFAPKWLEALKEIVPRISRVVLIVNPANPSGAGLSQFLEKLAPTYGVEVVPVPVRSAAEIESTITKVGSAPDHALIVLPDGLAVTHRDLTIELVNRARIPAVYPFRTFALNGKALGLEVPPTLLVLADEVIE